MKRRQAVFHSSSVWQAHINSYTRYTAHYTADCSHGSSKLYINSWHSYLMLGIFRLCLCLHSYFKRLFTRGLSLVPLKLCTASCLKRHIPKREEKKKNRKKHTIGMKHNIRNMTCIASNITFGFSVVYSSI